MMDDVAHEPDEMLRVPDSGSADHAFQHLALRAEAFVANQGGKAAEDLLIAHVFGSTGSPALWRPLLRNVLSEHESLTLRSDGSWLLANGREHEGQSPLSEFVVLDVETTGLEPSRQRIIEIAIVRIADGQQVEQWESLVNPEQRVPGYITKLTGIDDGLLAEAPRFGDIAAVVTELIGDAVVVGHNVQFDIGFLNGELKRLGQPAVINERLDTLALASHLMPDLRRPELYRAARALGLTDQTRGKHRAGADATLTGRLAVELLAKARAVGFSTLDDLKPVAQPATRRPRERMLRASAVVDRSILATIPRAPGVYIMRNANGRIVYVGKAKNLRERVGSYFSQPLGYTRKIDGLIESLSRIETEVVGSELQALLLESQMIRRHEPPHNWQLRRHEQYKFIRVDIGNPWPHVSIAKERANDGARYFGPFRNVAAAEKTVRLINRAVPLRTCSRTFRTARSYGRPCLELDLGRCLGPCVGRADRDEYLGLVRQVMDYIDGRDESLHEVLWQQLERAAAALDFERADRLRRDLHSAVALTEAQWRLRVSTESNWAVLVTPAVAEAQREALLIVGGQLWAQLTVLDGAPAMELAERLAASWCRFRATGIQAPDKDSVDDMHILGSWLRRYDGHPALIRFAGPEPEPDWLAIASRALALRRDELEFGAWLKECDANEGEGGESLSGADVGEGL
jgi:DNA polymerase III epsilon subunit family exonuclease